MQVTLTIGELLAALSGILGLYGATVSGLLAYSVNRVNKLQEKVEALMLKSKDEDKQAQAETHNWMQTIRSETNAKIDNLRAEFQRELAEVRRSIQ